MNKRALKRIKAGREIMLLSLIFTAFRKTSETDEIINNFTQKEADKTDAARIRCPFCQWSPKASSRWLCAAADAPEYFYGGCLTSWNTFETRGKCPTCAHQWRWTSCLSCQKWSKHADWYEKL